MEEKKEKTETQKVDKLSYEQLENVANQLSAQNRELFMKLQRAEQIIGTFNKLDYLFKVIELKDAFNDRDFVLKCESEIQDIMTPEEETEEDKEEK